MRSSLSSLRWQAAQIAAGRCRTCGKRNESPFRRCLACRKRDREYQRVRRGWDPWRPGGPGHPPKDD